MGFYTYPLLPLPESSASSWAFPFSDETMRDSKRTRRSISIPDVLGSHCSHSSSGSGSDGHNSMGMSRCSSTNSVNTMQRLHFRDHIWTCTHRYLAAEAVEESAEDTINNSKGSVAEEDGSADGMRLVQLLIAWAEAVACRDKSHAFVLLSELITKALMFGSSFQRVASCFAQGLADQLALIQPAGTVGVIDPMMNIMDSASEKMEEAFRLVYEICPHIQFGHFVANSTILEAFEGESFVHVVDLGMTPGLPHGHQWRGLIQSLANRSGQPVRHLRITGVGLCIERLNIIGEELQVYADNLGVTFEFSVVQKNLENLHPEDIQINGGEVLVINSILQLHCVVKESGGSLNSVLQMIHGLSPKVLAMVEQDSSHSGSFFLGRFVEALLYYSAIFDYLDAMLPKYDTKRAKIEQFFFAEEIKNIVSCEGPERVERHERVDQWRRRMSRAGLQAAPIEMVAQAKQWLHKNKFCDGYTIVEEKGYLVLGWKSKPIVAASCWKC